MIIDHHHHHQPTTHKMFIDNSFSSSYEQEMPPTIPYESSGTCSSKGSDIIDNLFVEDSEESLRLPPRTFYPPPADLPLSLSDTAIEENTLPRTKKAQRRFRFALFLKILLQVLEKSGDMALVVQARIVLSTCIRQSRMGQSEGPLDESLEQHLRPLVGELYWAQAHQYQQYYYNKTRSLKPRHSRAAAASRQLSRGTQRRTSPTRTSSSGELADIAMVPI